MTTSPQDTHIQDLTLLPWQQQVADTEKVHESYKVNVLVDEIGGVGKTTLVKWLTAKKLAFEIQATHRNPWKMLSTAYSSPDSKMYMFDLPKRIKKAKLGRFYDAITHIKRGDFYKNRRCLKEREINPPVVWILCDTMPDLTHLSAPKWALWKVENEQLIKTN